MNRLFITFSVFAMVYIGSNSVAGEYPVVELKDRMDLMTIDIGKLNVQETNKCFSIEEAANSNDYGIPQNTQMQKLDQELKKHIYERGIADCIQLRNDNAAALKDELCSMLKKYAYSEIATMMSRSNGYLIELEKMKRNLQGDNLEKEISVCNQDPDWCVITIIFPNTLDKMQNNVNYDRKRMKFLIEVLLKEAIYPLLDKEVYSKIYQPVTQCINRIK